MTVTQLFAISAAAGTLAALAAQWRRAPSASAESSRGGAAPAGGTAAIDVRQYGAAGDGVTDNSEAFVAVAEAVNRTRPGPGSLTTVLFPPGRYRYARGLVFTSPVRLTGAGATLDYTGDELAVKLGPDGLDARTWQDHLNYSVDGLTFTGGAAMIEGVYFNSWVTQPRVSGVTFVNFGAGGAHAIWFQSHNRDARVTDTRFFADDGNTHQFIRANGVDTSGRSDDGETRLTVSNVLATNQSTATGAATGIYTNGFDSEITSSRIEGFSPDIQVGSNAGASSAFTHIDLVSMEVRRGSLPCILYGEASGPWRSSFTDHLSVERSHCNVHNTALGTGAAFIAPASSDSRLRSAIIDGNLVSEVAPGAAPVVQNDLPHQTGNVAALNFAAGDPPVPLKPLHTRGAQIAPWSGVDEPALPPPRPANP